MNTNTPYRFHSWLLPVLVLAFFSSTTAARKPDEKPKLVDSGTFSVYVAGQRVANETFKIVQSSTVSTASSEFRAETPQGKSAQKAELQITPTGDLRRYEWREVSPGKAKIVVEPAEGFLIEHIVPDPPEKPVEHPFIVPVSTMVLDDYFFSQRQVLLWRYLAQACGEGLDKCRPGKMQFGVLVPRQRTQMLISVEYAGPEKVEIRGVQHELARFNLKSDDMEWALYLDPKWKLVRIVIPNSNTEVLRD
ncbi:MAG: hypothetical protein ACE14L_08510 [Terriglobales bacterium]